MCILYSHRGVLKNFAKNGNRCFLSKDDKLRSDKRNFPVKEVNTSNPPETKTMEYVDRAIANYIATESREGKIKLFQETGCKGPYALNQLSSHERILNTPVDPMHLYCCTLCQPDIRP